MPIYNLFLNHNSDSRRVFYLLVLIILGIFLLFRLPGLGVPFVSDELATVSLWAQMPYLKIFSNYQYPNNHIFLTLILSFLLKTFGLKEWLLRLPLMACGVVTLYLGFQLGRRVSGNIAVGLSTAFLMAISEKHIFFSTNARGYLVIMVLALIAVISLLNRIEDGSLNFQKSSKRFPDVLAFSAWVGIWIIGTWTIPTFLLFEFSLGICAAGILLAGSHLPPLLKTSLAIPLVSIVVGGIGFYFQYYVLISPAMLAEATSNAAQSSLPLFFSELLDEWTSPFESAGILFFLFALMGLWHLFQKNRVAALLMVCVWLGPVFIGIAGFLLGKLPGVPHARTFFYLQPFSLVLSVMGAREAGTRLLSLITRNMVVREKGLGIMTAVLVGTLFVVSGLKFFQNTYPQRMSRAPFHRIHEFIEKLHPNDLLLVSNAMHVEFYLYGAHDMRNRIENILRDGKLENIYYLVQEKNFGIGAQETEQTEKRFLNFPAMTKSAGKEGPHIPEKALEFAEQFGPLKFYQLKEDWIKPLPGLGKAGQYPTPLGTKWEKGPSGIRPLIRFEDSFTLAMEKKEALIYEASGLTLNLMEVAGNENKFLAYLLEGEMKEGKITLDPGWRPNAWILDHPYGSDIYSRPWNPNIFISQGAGNLSVLSAKLFQRLDSGAFKNFLSYRIEEPRAKRK
jgi:hypothetical protein